MSRERDQKYSRIQISMIKRLIEFLYRKNKKIVSVNQYYLAQILTNVFLQSNQINKIGSYFLSLNQLVTFYNNISDEQHLANIFEVMELIDRESYEIFTKLIQKQANKNLFLNIFISFCLSLGVSLLNIQCARFTFDQLLIKERNILDIHIMFCIVILILSQNELKTEEIQIKTYFAKSLEIKIDLFQEIFNHIYENIPVTASRFKQIDRFQISKIIKQKMERSVYKLLKKNELTNTFNIKKQIVKREPQISSKKKYFGLINPYVNLD